MRSTVLAFLLLSARGGVAALAAWLICRALRRAHAPSRLLCWLWLAVGLRFVLPWGIPLKLPRPESAPLAAAADTVQELGELPLLPPAPAAAAAAAPLPWYARLTPWHALAAVWLVGVLVLAVRGGIGYLKLKRCVALACKTPDGCYGGACVPTPFTLGFVRPRVYLPDSLQGPARQAVLLHERTHIRRRDPLVKPLFYAVVCLHWFNPLAWLALCAFEHDMEAACDEAAVQGCTLAERSTYCESLLHFAMQGRPIRTPGSLAFGQGSVKERIVHLLHYRRLGAGALALCAVAVGVSVTACMVRPQVEASHAAPEPPGKWSFRLSRRIDPGQATPVLVWIDQYLSDLNAYRDDAHLAAWRPYNISGATWEAFTRLWRGARTLDDVCEQLAFRGHARTAYAAALIELVVRGWLEADSDGYRVTAAGLAVRQEAEAATDRYFYAPWRCLSDSETDELRALLAGVRDGLAG